MNRRQKMWNWLKEFFGIGLNEVKTEIKQVEVKAKEVVEKVETAVSAELKEVETKITEAISTAVAAEQKAVKAVKTKAKDTADKVKSKTKKNAK